MRDLPTFPWPVWFLELGVLAVVLYADTTVSPAQVPPGLSPRTLSEAMRLWVLWGLGLGWFHRFLTHWRWQCGLRALTEGEEDTEVFYD